MTALFGIKSHCHYYHEHPNVMNSLTPKEHAGGLVSGKTPRTVQPRPWEEGLEIKRAVLAKNKQSYKEKSEPKYKEKKYHK